MSSVKLLYHRYMCVHINSYICSW